ncbi:hypothetical protein [Sphingomonas sp. Leaf21]|uniref:hypothetical protein n=1 Tax=Sphingomonas sp. Leaf21 TaxID=2876550 RepID=UPI001E48B923|nr:hypothetical protein [Sphingomonas sp. Leaf21]
MASVRILSGVAIGLSLAGCAARETAKVAPPPVMIPAPQPQYAKAPLPPGATPGMRIPVRLPDGNYDTPNRSLTSAATIWHLRSALNVAALACRGPDEGQIVTRYNTMLTVQRITLAAAEKRYSAEYQSQGGDWRDRYDDAMTRLYNFFSITPVRKTFCAAADQVLSDISGGAVDGFEGGAARHLDQLNAPFVAFFRAYDAWRSGTMVPVEQAASPLSMAASATPQVTPRPAAQPVLSSQPVPAAKPYAPPVINPPSLTVNPAALQ